MTESEQFLAWIQAGKQPPVLQAIAEQPRLAQAAGPGGSALHLACLSGDVILVNALLDAGAAIDARNPHGRTALHDSIEFGQCAVTGLLLERGASVDICAAAILGQVETLRRCLAADAALVNDRSTGLSPLGWAAFGNQVASANALLAAGAALDDGELLCAASVGHVEVGRVLLEAGADPNQVDRNGFGALHAAAAMRYTFAAAEFVSLLLEFGAEPRGLSKDGHSALEIAQRAASQPDLPGAKRRGYRALIERLTVALGQDMPDP